MAKRPSGGYLLGESSKRQKTFDPYKLSETFEKLSITPNNAYIAFTTFSSVNNSRFSKARDEYKNSLIKWNTIPRVKDQCLLDLNISIETLKSTLLKLKCCKSEDIDINQLFSTVFNVLSRLEFKVHCGRYSEIEHFVIREYIYKQAQMFSEQYHINCEMKNSGNYITSRAIQLLDDDPVCHNEKYIQARQIIECIAQIARASKEFSEMMLTEKLELELSQELPSPSDKPTIIDLVCMITKTIIKDNRYISNNFGLVVALTHLLESLTHHYAAYKYSVDIDKGLEIMFELVLRIATFDVEIMLSLSKSFVGIAKNPNRMTLFNSMCISSPYKNLVYSIRFRLYTFELAGCKFQIFFLLLNHAFRLYDADKVTGDRLEALIQLTKNMNYLSFIFLVNDSDMKFMMQREDCEDEVESACCCYRFLLYSTLILNDILLRNQNSNPEHYFTILSLRNDSIIILNSLLNYSYNNSTFFKIRTQQLLMNEIYATLNFVNLDFYNLYRTRIHPDKRKVYELYILKNSLNPKASMNPFKLFLKKFNPKNGKDSVKFKEEDLYKNRQSVKELKYPTMKMSKDDLLKELADNFKADW